VKGGEETPTHRLEREARNLFSGGVPAKHRSRTWRSGGGRKLGRGRGHPRTSVQETFVIGRSKANSTKKKHQLDRKKLITRLAVVVPKG